MKTSDFSYTLPKELIAQDPLEDRSASRLLVMDRETGAFEHSTFKQITDYLKPGDCLVLNNTRVIPARLIGVREETGASIEVLLLKRLDADTWETLVRPGKKARPGTRIVFGDGLLVGEVVAVLAGGNREIRFSYEGIFEEILDALGQMPLPPYITHELKDKDRYQTVYAKVDGSAAAPTAGLHFTPELLEEVRNKGVDIAEITLHVGLGTFRPVKEEEVADHQMHAEYYEIDADAAEKINRAHAGGGRVVCVGTTTCRTIEAAAQRVPAAQEGVGDPPSWDSAKKVPLPMVQGNMRAVAADWEILPTSGWTDIFLYPGYEFKLTDALITNFHLPESTLLMLVSAFAGREHILAAYEEAIRERYRFFSFGDAMFLTSLGK